MSYLYAFDEDGSVDTNNFPKEINLVRSTNPYAPPAADKLRRIEKTESEIEEEHMQYFELPRKSCWQIIPELSRLNSNKYSRQIQQHRYHVLKKLMKRARLTKIDEAFEKFYALDASDHVVPNGEVSKKIYEELFNSRDFDLYGKLMDNIPPLPVRKFQEMELLAEKLHIPSTLKLDQEAYRLHKIEEAKDVYTGKYVQKLPKLMTEQWKIGRVEKYNAPVGFSTNIHQPLHSLGNEIYYPYDGYWKNGKMDGLGKYLYSDGFTYEGNFSKNRPHGEGVAEYPDGQRYNGEWLNGKYEGKGTATYIGETSYTGSYSNGRREGWGKLTYASGLYYEGEFKDGQPNGKGFMKSNLTGWAYEGTFVRGFILGSGQLITPPPENKRIVYYWSENKPTVSLPGLVRYHMDQLELEKRESITRSNEIFAPLRGAQLKAYVDTIRSSVYKEKQQAKKEKYNEQLTKLKEQKAKLHEARLKALAGD
eukprot:gene6890-9440_t